MILKLYLNCVYYKATMESSSVCMKLMHKPARGSVRHPTVQKVIHTATSSAAAVAIHHLCQNPALSAANDDVVDGDMDELDEEADEAHEQEADAGRAGDLGELCNF